MEKTSGSERPQSENGKDQNYDLRLKPALTQRLRKHPCAVCGKGVGSNSSYLMDISLEYTRNVAVLKEN